MNRKKLLINIESLIKEVESFGVIVNNYQIEDLELLYNKLIMIKADLSFIITETNKAIEFADTLLSDKTHRSIIHRSNYVYISRINTIKKDLIYLVIRDYDFYGYSLSEAFKTIYNNIFKLLIQSSITHGMSPNNVTAIISNYAEKIANNFTQYTSEYN